MFLLIFYNLYRAILLNKTKKNMFSFAHNDSPSLDLAIKTNLRLILHLLLDWCFGSKTDLRYD